MNLDESGTQELQEVLESGRSASSSSVVARNTMPAQVNPITADASRHDDRLAATGRDMGELEGSEQSISVSRSASPRDGAGQLSAKGAQVPAAHSTPKKRAFGTMEYPEGANSGAVKTESQHPMLAKRRRTENSAKRPGAAEADLPTDPNTGRRVLGTGRGQEGTSGVIPSLVPTGAPPERTAAGLS